MGNDPVHPNRADPRGDHRGLMIAARYFRDVI
jgi:hypothetical protein